MGHHPAFDPGSGQNEREKAQHQESPDRRLASQRQAQVPQEFLPVGGIENPAQHCFGAFHTGRRDQIGALGPQQALVDEVPVIYGQVIDFFLSGLLSRELFQIIVVGPPGFFQ